MDDASFLAHYGVTRAEAQDPDFSPDSELSHAGVKGMKWGVRKAKDKVVSAYNDHGKNVDAARKKYDDGSAVRDYNKGRREYNKARSSANSAIKSAKEQKKSGSLSSTEFKAEVKKAKAAKNAALLAVSESDIKYQDIMSKAAQSKNVTEFLIGPPSSYTKNVMAITNVLESVNDSLDQRAKKN